MQNVGQIMQRPKYESALNTWLAAALRERQLDANEESAQAGGRRLDVEVQLGYIKVALEAEQGHAAGKRRSAIKDADARLDQELADCAVAVCYPDNLFSADDLAECEVIYALRTHKDRPPAAKTEWQRGDLDQLARVIKKIPDQLGDPDSIANALSFSLDRAVARLSESQKQDLAECLDLPAGKPLKIAADSPSSRYNQAAKRAMLVIATAAMFHTQLDKRRHEIAPLWDNRFSPLRSFEGDWPPPTAAHCAKDDDPIGAFDAAWDLWLAVDYKPIFATARNALRGCAQDAAFSAAVQGTARAAMKVTRNIVGLRHDLLGRIFHKVLETARYDGSFYTTTAAATLLAALAINKDMCDWSDSAAIARLRITDPACGTGTLLMAAAERIRDLAGAAGNQNGVSQALIESVLTGYDVNLTATHLAATTLGLLSPTTTFREMKVGRALLGVEHGAAFLGSLEFLSPQADRQPRLLPWPNGVKQIDTEQEVARAEPADLIIMNPPFTRDSLRHDQFSRQEEKMLKAREKELFDAIEGGIHRSHNGGGFLALADFIAKPSGGTVAVVLPLVGATNYSTRMMRQYLAERFHIETIVTSHDPSRIYFSENTNIGEMLLVCRRWQSESDKPPTRVINLYENPPTPAAAIGAAQDIIDDKRERIKGTVQEWPTERIAAGDWGAVQFLSPYLCERFIELRAGKFFRTSELGQLAEVGPAGRRTQDAFKRSKVPDDKARAALWYHKTDVTQKMSTQTDSYLIANTGRESYADYLWTTRGQLMIVNRMRLNTVRCISVRLNERALGSLWVPIKFSSDKPDKEVGQATRDMFEKAACVYLNSTIGILAILGDRTNKIPSYPQFSLDDLRRIPVPDFAKMDEAKVKMMTAAYDDLCDSILLPLPQMNECDTRKKLDDMIVAALGIDEELAAAIRRELTREPSITGRPYEQN